MRSFFVPALAALSCLASCSRTPYAVLPRTPAYQPQVAASTSTPAAPLPEAPAAPATLAAATQVAAPVRLAETTAAAPTAGHGRSRPVAAGAALVPRPLVRELRRQHRSETAAVTRSASLGSSLLAVLGLLAAFIGGLFLFLALAFGASAGVLIVAGLLFVGGVFLAVRSLRKS